MKIKKWLAVAAFTSIFILIFSSQFAYTLAFTFSLHSLFLPPATAIQEGFDQASLQEPALLIEAGDTANPDLRWLLIVGIVLACVILIIKAAKDYYKERKSQQLP